MIRVAVKEKPPATVTKHIVHRIKPSRTVCGARVGDPSELTITALESDCDDCRVASGIARMSDQAYGSTKEKIGVKTHSKYDPQPMRDIEPLEEIVKRRSGL